MCSRPFRSPSPTRNFSHTSKKRRNAKRGSSNSKPACSCKNKATNHSLQPTLRVPRRFPLREKADLFLPPLCMYPTPRGKTNITLSPVSLTQVIYIYPVSRFRAYPRYFFFLVLRNWLSLLINMMIPIQLTDISGWISISFSGCFVLRRRSSPVSSCRFSSSVSGGLSMERRKLALSYALPIATKSSDLLLIGLALCWGLIYFM